MPESINAADEGACRSLAGTFGGLFNQTAREGGGSIFAGDRIEFLKSPGAGAKGHIAIRCNQVERAVAYLAGAGIQARPGSARSDHGMLKSVYLDLDLGGFAVHLVRA